MNSKNQGRTVVLSRRLSRIRSGIILSAAAVAGTISARHALAASATWNGAVDGNWSTANGTTGNWGNAAAAPGLLTNINNADVATFSAIGANATGTPIASPFFTVNVDASNNRNVRGVTFDNVGYTSGTPNNSTPAYTLAGGNLLLASTGTLQTTANINATQNISSVLWLEGATNTTAGTYTLTNSSTYIAGNGSLNITGNISGDTTAGNATTESADSRASPAIRASSATTSSQPEPGSCAWKRRAAVRASSVRPLRNRASIRAAFR